jgi:hypothetical protein
MNNEPVAWMRENEAWEGKYNFSKEKPPAYPNAIPLYTHPVKEQDTDCQYCKQGCIRCDARKQLTDEEIIEELKLLPQLISMEDEDFINFARAILRKAQEK